MINGIRVTRIKLYTLQLPRIRFFQFFKYIEYIVRAVSKCSSNSIIHCHDYSALPAGCIAKLIYKNVQIIYDAHELESERYGLNKYSKFIIKNLERYMLPFVKNTVTVSDSIANFYSDTFGIDKPLVILNAPNYVDIEKSSYFRDYFQIPIENKIFLYQGGLSSGRGILEFFDLISSIKNVSYIIMGYGPLSIKIKEIVKKNENLYFHDAVPYADMHKYTSSADFGVCIESNACLSWDFALPNKIFEYAMSGLPVIVSNLKEISNFVKINNIGVVLSDEIDCEAFHKIYLDLISNHEIMKENIKKVSKKYNWENEEIKLLQMYEKIS
jgi:glycosyltransferase involved in cell wall biosynthesis